MDPNFFLHSKYFLIQKDFISKKICGIKEILGFEQSRGPKILQTQKDLGPKRFWAGKFFCQKNLGQKRLWVSKIFGSEEIFGQNFGSKTIWV